MEKCEEHWEQIKFVQVLQIDGHAIIIKYWFAKVQGALVKYMLLYLYSSGESCLEFIPFGKVDATWAHIRLLMFGSHFLSVLANGHVSIEEVEKPHHVHDRNTLKVFNRCL